MRHTAMVLASHIERTYRRLDYHLRGMASVDGPAGPETCPLCGHQLGAPEQRPPRDTRTAKGRLRRLPAEVLTWRKCGGCSKHQRGQREG